MKIIDIRILPPIAIGRLGSATEPLAAFDLEVSETKPLDFRTIIPKETLNVNPTTGVIEAYLPEQIVFKDSTGLGDSAGKIHPVAPFLEVFVITDQDENTLVPLTEALLEEAGLTLSNLSWHVDVANIKLYRRTQNVADKINAQINNITTHERMELKGLCDNFLAGKYLPLGTVQFIQPTEDFPEIRFRYTPGPGKVYGASKTRISGETMTEEKDPIYEQMGDAFLIYDKTKDWFGYTEGNQERPILTNPAMIFAGYDDATNGTRVSWGYLDDECDGFISVHLDLGQGDILKARTHISAGPPAFAPDTLPVRVVTDEIEQILKGPIVQEPVSIEEAEDIIRRALETVRLMNTAIMNGNAYNGKYNTASTMVRQDSNDFNRMYEPIMATSLVDNLAVRAIHERVFNGISTGLSPWFDNAIRRPDKIGDLSDEERRKMPGLMRGADGRALCFTHRQIDTIIKAAANAMFKEASEQLNQTCRTIPVSDLQSQLHYRGKGNPFSILPRSAISNCFPGLEFDFRNLWRRAFKGLTLIENNNFVIEGEGELERLKYHRLVGINGKPTMVPTTGPTMPGSGNVSLMTKENPNGVSFMEWSNNLAAILQLQGQEVECYFTKEESNEEIVVEAKDLNVNNNALELHVLTVNTFFEDNSAAFTEDILEPGELTQGLCAPWQNDYRECACYYWAASRPDYVNVEPDKDGLSKGDNWMSKKRSGSYIPDDRVDSRLLTYDDLFMNWEGELQFIVRGKDALGSNDNKEA
ncbi:hypothetical protein [Aureispira sp. CCB-QB1]|uniref:hypothetical protein n=1 Tax=Aureispira sp. CCB-QB1 TaxID=1313421 RepID=UPI000697556B|nr:hypothetical protein [Aureispira sp. CCB-QB1]